MTITENTFLSQAEARAAGSVLSPQAVVAFYLSSTQEGLGPNTVRSPPVAPAVTEVS